MAYTLQGNFNPQKLQITSTQLIDNTNSAMTASQSKSVQTVYPSQRVSRIKSP